eukprot:gene10133-biopygen6174
MASDPDKDFVWTVGWEELPLLVKEFRQQVCDDTVPTSHPLYKSQRQWAAGIEQVGLMTTPGQLPASPFLRFLQSSEPRIGSGKGVE